MPNYTSYTIEWTDPAHPHRHGDRTNFQPEKRYRHLITLGGERCDATMQSIVAALRSAEVADLKVTREMSVEDDVTPPVPQLLPPHMGDRLAEDGFPLTTER